MEKKLISIIIPLYNEEERIASTLKKVENYIKENSNQFELVLVNDGSKDKTEEILKKANYICRKKIISFTKNRGKGAAVKAGMLAAEGQFIAIYDADGSTPIDTINESLSFLKDYDVVIGSRYIKGSKILERQSKRRQILSRIGNSFIRTILWLPFKDTQCGFKILKSEVGKTIAHNLTIDRWGFDVEMLVIAQLKGYKIKEIPVEWTNDSNSTLRASRAAFSTLKEVIQIKKNVNQKKYL